ncbi:B2 bradykinin receptor-like [Toxotes jaculatrix]|uniref:B2 bradykinin receptor-like n=1 Tax=Toxotes jaculatrix TaxID=941984 RepID=UPI001B3A90E3|nr:B2 bradykinin receptor-like [Toxotes jaculatrix]
MSLLSTSIPATSSSADGCQNCSNEGKDEKWTTSVVPVYILCITVLGIVFNVFVLMVFCLHKKACTVAEIYLSNLAAADLVLVCSLPFWAVNVAKKYDWIFGRVLCKLVNIFISVNAYCSIYFLVLVSIDRFVALVHPLTHERMRRPKYAKLGCLLVWSLGLLLSVPTIIYREVHFNSTTNETMCYFNYTDTTVELLCEGVMPMFGFIIPIFIISFCTCKIIQALNNRSTEGLNTQKVEQKATTLIMAVLVAFLICWVPFHLVKIIRLLLTAEVLRSGSLESIVETYTEIVIYVAFFNSVLNPILYVIVGKNFQKKVKELFRQWSRNRRASLSLTTSRFSLSRSVKDPNISCRPSRL